MIDNPRIDLLVARYGRTLLVALAVCGVVALALSGWAVASPETTTTTQQTGTDRVSTEVGTEAIVETGGLWPEGTVLEDEPVYLTNATETLTLTPRTTVPTNDASVYHDVTLRYEAVRDGAVFWNETSQLSRQAPRVRDGVASSSVDVDVAAVRDRMGEIEREVAGVGDVRVVAVVETEYDTGTTADAFTIETELVATERAFWLAQPVPSHEETHPQYALVTESEPRSTALVGLLAVVGTLSLGAAWGLDRRRPIDEKSARRAVHERRYAEWISRGSIPMWIGDHHIALDTLEDVVDVAIDTSERVVHDRQRGLFAVVSDDVVYYYTDRGLWEETAWPNMNLEDTTGGAEDTAGAPPAAPGSAPADGPVGPGGPPTDIDPDDEDAWEQL
ncbi:hypothetical protein Halru_0318 [Halovivax ruber XH-70]|uniref:DUF5305 domain-containing protein n=1 Tax=Halovivax ruber (strain DSM 18193 / JCM 13892 / XH-70) TaxID=797302 RepID=L0IAI5_HALRX|nr:DUF5305 domain-containing protein [Halovivax ruber]AGB14962.1 hypothetical protein Halru_0318 [Halovivax ruber XH-70]